ncbi:MAG: cytochrome c3 family protein [Sulfurimonas sp.]|nr:cytochrome c3 family protein [Sulfurimonas sp.]
MTRYSGELSTIVIKVPTKNIDKNVTLIKISLNNKIVQELNVTKEKEIYCQTIKINPSKNIVRVATYSKKEKLQESTINLYYLPELYEGSSDDSENYNLNFFHTDKKEKKCVSCHNMTSNIPTNEDILEDITQTTCYNCHKNKLNTRNTHAPAANWRCIDCHDGKTAEYNMDLEGESKYLARDPIKTNCASCHDKVTKWENNKYTHGPVNDGRCVRCHDPHGSDNEFFLRKPIWDICTTCHAEKADGKHVVSSFVFSRNSGAHPTRSDTAKDPARPEREFTCTSCHNPHGSSGIYLLRMNGSVPFGVCKRCHDK